ncbi:MAG: C40 family peptidase [Bacteroidetes bacterium]|nr:C40 family peptidase [Bacteroidota bacterium]
MKLRLTQFICLLLILSSCKSLRLSSRTNSNAENTAVAPKYNSTKFLDDVSITPGSNKTNYKYGEASLQLYQKSNVVSNSSFSLEKADWLQIKYAIITDMPVEQMNDLPLLREIDHWWGIRYCYGGTDESCIDCSAFTQTLLHNVFRVDVPRTANEQYDFATHIGDQELREGDLVFFKTGKHITHVGLYVGNYKFVHASTSSGVTISDLSDSYWSKKYAGAGRVIIDTLQQVTKNISSK